MKFGMNDINQTAQERGGRNPAAKSRARYERTRRTVGAGCGTVSHELVNPKTIQGSQDQDGLFKNYRETLRSQRAPRLGGEISKASVTILHCLNKPFTSRT